MALIASVNYVTRRIALSIDSVGLSSIDPIDIYKEYRARRQLNTDGGQNFDPLITAFGNQSIGGGDRTPEFTDLATGVKVIPYDADQIIRITGFLVSTADGVSGSALFDRSTIIAAVDIDYFPPATKIVEVSTGGLSGEDKTNLATAAAQATTAATNSTTLLNRWTATLSETLAKMGRRLGIGDTARHTATSITTSQESYTITQNGENDNSVSED